RDDLPAAVVRGGVLRAELRGAAGARVLRHDAGVDARGPLGDALVVPAQEVVLNIRIDGAQYAYRASGAGQPVLLLHGFPFTSESFWPQLDAPPAGARLICPDHRGFGGS